MVFKKNNKNKNSTSKIVTIGGGTGSFTLLTGLKEYPVDISAIVTMADDGGSTGILRDEIGVLPPGDVRQCIVALADASPEVRELFNYRFTNGDIKGHNAGNIFLSALEKVTGSLPAAIEVASTILNIRGRVLPVTIEDMRLVIELKNGVALYGESKLDDNEDVRSIGVRGVSLAKPVCANEEALNAIKEADMVVIGPGDLYGSIIPNLLVSGIPKALADTKAKIVIVANVTNKKGLTDMFSAGDYLKAIEQYIYGRSVDVLVCNSGTVDSKLVQKYEDQEGEGFFVFHASKDRKDKYDVIEQDFLNCSRSADVQMPHTFIRHDSERLARAIIKYVQSL